MEGMHMGMIDLALSIKAAHKYALGFKFPMYAATSGDSVQLQELEVIGLLSNSKAELYLVRGHSAEGIMTVEQIDGFVA